MRTRVPRVGNSYGKTYLGGRFAYSQVGLEGAAQYLKDTGLWVTCRFPLRTTHHTLVDIIDTANFFWRREEVKVRTSSVPKIIPSHVESVKQSPLNAFRWCLALDCGHDQWITAKHRPTRQTLRCIACSAKAAARDSLV